MPILILAETLGEPATAALLGAVTGGIFGVAAQRARFCLRAATVAIADGKPDDRFAVWLLTFSAAVFWVQAAETTDLFRTGDARIMAVPGSWSGAVVGGLLFGAGMILARGCSGRLLVLAATGNLRSLVAGLIFAVVAQMSLNGLLTPLRDAIAALWITPNGRNIELLSALNLPQSSGLVGALVLAVASVVFAVQTRIDRVRLFFASGVGFSVAVGWVFTFQLSQVSFTAVPVESATFTGPSAHMLMFLLDRTATLEFDIGLVPGVFLGAFFAAVVNHEFRFQGYDGAASMRRSIIGAALMGFGGMLAGGCAIGAGVSGGSIFAATAWCALFFMWVGAVMTHRLFNAAK